MSDHTPPPWKVKITPEYPDAKTDEDLANERLMETAPEMLAMLERIAASPSIRGLNMMIVWDVEAVIKKAKGRS